MVPEDEYPNYWRRNFRVAYRSPKIARFDLIVGGILPPLLLLFDPGIFRPMDLCSGVLSTLNDYGLFAYLAILPGVTVFIVWQILYERIRNLFAVFLAGIFLAGSLVAMAVGIAMLPLTVPGLVALIGILGFLPFLCAFVYVRNFVYALQKANLREQVLILIPVLVLAGMVSALAVPGVAYWQVNRVISETVADYVDDPGPQAARLAADRLLALNDRCLSLCRGTIRGRIRRTIGAEGVGRPTEYDELRRVLQSDGVFLAICAPV